MKLCSNCKATIGDDWYCHHCQSRPANHMGFLQLAPQFDSTNHGYDADTFGTLFDLESENFWFLARNALIIHALAKYFPSAKSFLEIGCGTGFVLSGIEQARPDLQMFGSEALVEGLDIASRRSKRTMLFQMDALEMPFADEFDLIGAFDVLEHIVEDEQVLGEMYKSIRPGGGIVLTVPQHPSLWSPSDDYAKHERRYQPTELVKKVQRAGFSIRHKTSFVTFLLPLLIASRMWRRLTSTPYDPASELKLSSLTNRILGSVMAAEGLILRAGISLPVGGSLLVVAVKEKAA